MVKEKAKDAEKRLSKTPSTSSKATMRSSSGSPRLTSAPATIKGIAVKTPAKKRSPSKSNALALSLHVIGDEVNEDQPLPLKMYDPNLSAEKCLRRSPRCSTNKYRSVSEQSAESSDLKSLPALSPSVTGALRKYVRTSPRLSSGSVFESDVGNVNFDKSDAELESIFLKWPDSSEKRLPKGNAGARVVGEKWLRSRTVPMSVDKSALSESSNEQLSKKVKISSARSDVMRSPRFLSSSVVIENSDVNVKRNFLALPEPPSSSAKQLSKKTKTTLRKSGSNGLGERCLRSRTVPFQLAGTDDDDDSKSALIELPNVSADRKPREKIKSAFGTCDSDVSGEKSLRSRSVPIRFVGNEEIERNSAVIEFPDISGDKKQPEEIKTTSASCDTDVLFEKCLRSRKIPFRIFGTENNDAELAVSADERQTQKIKACASSEKKEGKQKTPCFFIGEPIPDEEARERWSWRYELKSQRSKCQSWKLNDGEEDEIILNVECHYTQAKVDSCIFSLGDCAYIKGNGRQKYVGRILEFFRTMEGENYFRVQWFFRAEDTVMEKEAAFHDKKRLFYSTLMNDNLLNCIISKVSVIQVAPPLGLLQNSTPPSDFYYDMEYCVEYSTFRTLLTDDTVENYDLSTPDDIEAFRAMITATPLEDMPSCESYKAELALLDLYCGCGGMSTGFCLGAKLSSVNLATRWAVDADRSACDSLKLNHPEAQVRHDTAEDFLELLKGWEKLCQWYVFNNLDRTLKSRAEETREVKSNVNSPSDVKIHSGEYEVLRLVDICYGDHCKTGKRGLKFKVRWKGYSSDEDTWEPIEGLRNCRERIQDFVRNGFKSKILPLPGDVDVLCGGPPCQGISGYNRFRNIDAPLADERNRQIVVFMDIVKFLRPKYVLMENVVDILKFDKASLARYALSRLVHMKYQARLGTIAAGCYGLPQFRLRVFLWGALPGEKLPQFPLPTHDVVVRYWPPSEFERNTVAYDEGERRELEEAVILRDAISDLPAVTSHEIREQMAYEMPPETEFQKYIRLTKDEMMGFAKKGVIDAKKSILYDHRPYQLSEDDYLRVCQIPHKKGANFRDLPGVVVGPNNVAHRDTTKEQMLPSGKPMVPDYAFTFEQGKSKRPFARLWWDETVPTVVTFPNLHSQAALHPEQDRVLTVREYARLQGFPDFYRFCGTVKERYCQVGNAVAVPVARALGYAVGMAFRKLGGNEPLMTLPPKFAFQRFPTDEILVS